MEKYCILHCIIQLILELNYIISPMLKYPHTLQTLGCPEDDLKHGHFIPCYKVKWVEP